MIAKREMLESDYEAVAVLCSQLGYSCESSKTRERIRNLQITSNNVAFVATHDDIVVGWIYGFYTIRIESDPFVEIWGLVVDSGFRNKKIGSLLVDNIRNWAKSLGSKTLRVRCNTTRTESHEFYKRVCFDLMKQQMVFIINI